MSEDMGTLPGTTYVFHKCQLLLERIKGFQGHKKPQGHDAHLMDRGELTA